ncbi:hypothetical protein FIBSPDRAFT_559459 [Athelia psychrophila]|uniref:F-box domain-containing protein n=1 Tax=Athelia psychrophila TaxID=1759441 RepID=A0A166I9I8_9AGAM|nr:hypothetical protein FIBSPDRAFT_559459 [Fibularhizoctonia sp. CBS 109695]
MRVLDLPLDVWIAIASLLSIEDILAVQNTCKFLHDSMAERSIWHSAITDIASVIHLPGLQDQLPHMSTEVIRARVVRTWGIHRELQNNPLKPRSVQKRTCDANVMHVYFVPGGEWIVLALFDGGIDLCATRNIPQPTCSIPCVRRRADINFQIGMSSSCHLGTLIHRTEKRWSQG